MIIAVANHSGGAGRPRAAGRPAPADMAGLYREVFHH
jgi:hypothetical protein